MTLHILFLEGLSRTWYIDTSTSRVQSIAQNGRGLTTPDVCGTTRHHVHLTVF